MLPDDGPAKMKALEAEVLALRDALLAAEAARVDEIGAAHPARRRSAANLVHYVELRDHDVRELQRRLGALGLSSLGRCEPYVLATIEAVLAVLARLAGHEPPPAVASIGLAERSGFPRRQRRPASGSCAWRKVHADHGDAAE